MYASGKFNFPTSVGSFSIAGLGFEPQGLVMIGSNKAVSGTLLTGLDGPGLFISVSGRDWQTPGVVQTMSISPNPNTLAGQITYRTSRVAPISMPTDDTTASVIDYRADGLSFDADGFSMIVTNAATGVRPVHWFAWDLPTAMVTDNFPPNNSFDAGFDAWSAMVLQTVAQAPFTEGYNDGECWMSFGTGHYPEVAGFDATRWRSSVIYTQGIHTAFGDQGFTGEFVLSGSSGSDWTALDIADVIDTIGPALLEGFRRFRPYAEIASHSEFIDEGGGAGYNFQGALWKASEGWTGFVTIPAGGSVTVNHPSHFEEFSQVMFTTTDGITAPAFVNQAYGAGTLGYDDQGCIVFGNDGSLYQSNTECVAHCTAAGYSAASGYIYGPSFTLTSTHAGLGDFTVVWHAWGGPARGWMPQMYRWWPRKPT